MPRPARKRPISVTPYEILDGAGNPTGSWEAFITLGRRPNGKPNVIHRRGKSRESVENKIRAVEEEYERTQRVRTARSPLMADDLRAWLEEGRTSPGRWSYNAWKDYRLCIENYLIPHVGGVRRHALDVDNVKYVIATVSAKISEHAAAKAYRCLRVWNSDRLREGAVTEHIVKKVREPKPEPGVVGGLTGKEAERIGVVLATHRDRARYEMALVLGMRQGEVLGLMRRRPEDPRSGSDVDLARRSVRVREKLYRRTYEHGCGDAHACGSRARPGYPNGIHRDQPETCPGAGAKHDRYHRRGCPTPRPACPPGCVKHAKACPHRIGGLKRDKPKTAAGRRPTPIPKPLARSLAVWEATQAEERAAASDEWVDSGHYFTNRLGGPIDPRLDYQTWRDILTAANVDPARLHDARRFAATYLRSLGTQAGVIKRMLGWASESMVEHYDDGVDADQRRAADRLAEVVYGTEKKKAKKAKKAKKKARRDGRAEQAPSVVSDDQATDQATTPLAKILPIRRKAS
jgi:hypothetical protein